MLEAKVCTGCGASKPLSEFHAHKDAAGRARRHSKCRPCRRLQFKAYAKTPAGKQAKRRGILARDYGIHPAEYAAMLERQNGVCAICEQPETRTHRNGTPLSLSVDHDHTTGKVRGLLCSACNVGLGSFADSTYRLVAAAKYIEAHKT